MASASAPDANAVTSGMRKSEKDVDNIQRKVKSLQDYTEKFTKRKEEACKRLASVQQAFEQKDRLFQEYKTFYEEVDRKLKEKLKRRDELRSELQKRASEVKALVETTIEQSRSASHTVEVMAGSYHATERAALRGYSCSRDLSRPREGGPQPTSARSPLAPISAS